MSRPSKYSKETLASWLPFLSGTLKETVEVAISHSKREAAKALHIAPRTLRHRLNQARLTAQDRGMLPEFGSVHPIPDGMRIKGISSNVDELGMVKQAWVKVEKDKDYHVKLLMESLDVFLEEVRGKSTAPRSVNTLTGVDADVMTWYPIGDHHIGMYSWADETGASYDADIAFELLTKAIDRLVDAAPASREAAILNLGDFFHMDNSRNMTLQSGNILDVDTRWAKVVQVGMKALKYCVERALDKHQTVYLYNMLGNHDQHSAMALSLAMDALFDGNPRVQVSTDPANRQYHVFGKCLVGMTHGDWIKKKENYGPVMATERPQDWGSSTFRYWYLGHLHNSDRQEYPGVLVETFRTLAARDAWHAASGYGAGRDMTAIVLHKDYGEIERHTVPVAMLEMRKT